MRQWWSLLQYKKHNKAAVRSGMEKYIGKCNIGERRWSVSMAHIHFQGWSWISVRKLQINWYFWNAPAQGSKPWYETSQLEQEHKSSNTRTPHVINRTRVHNLLRKQCEEHTVRGCLKVFRLVLTFEHRDPVPSVCLDRCVHRKSLLFLSFENRATVSVMSLVYWYIQYLIKTWWRIFISTETWHRHEGGARWAIKTLIAQWVENIELMPLHLYKWQMSFFFFFKADLKEGFHGNE